MVWLLTSISYLHDFFCLFPYAFHFTIYPQDLEYLQGLIPIIYASTTTSSASTELNSFNDSTLEEITNNIHGEAFSVPLIEAAGDETDNNSINKLADNNIEILGSDNPNSISSPQLDPQSETASDASNQGIVGNEDYPLNIPNKLADNNIEILESDSPPIRLTQSDQLKNLSVLDDGILTENLDRAYQILATNVALGKPISSSENFSNSEYITDGERLDAGAYADSTPFEELVWVQVNLQAAYDIEEIDVWHYYGDQRQYHDVIVQHSNDVLFSDGVITVFNNDSDNSAGMGTGSDSEYFETSAGKVIAVDSVAAQYVRFYSKGNSVNGYSHYVEIKIYGTLRESSGTFLKIPTPYDDGTNWEGSTNQTTHPSVIQFDEVWNGYKYWMAFTPYPYADSTKENPSIVASNDGFSWIVPERVNNPIVPWNNGIVAYNSDTSLFYNANTGEMEMWYRQVQWVPNTSNQAEVIFRVKTTDSINWTLPEEMIHSNYANILQYISPSIIYEDNLYKMWAMRDYSVFYAESTDGIAWSDINYAKTNGDDFITWHPSVVKIDEKYYLLNNDPEGQIKYSISTDGINYSSEKILLEPNYDTRLYRATMTTGSLGFYVYYGYITPIQKNTIWMAYGSNLDTLGMKPQGVNLAVTDTAVVALGTANIFSASAKEVNEQTFTEYASFVQIVSESEMNYDATITHETDSFNAAPIGVERFRKLGYTSGYKEDVLSVSVERALKTNVPICFISTESRELGWVDRALLIDKTYNKNVATKAVNNPTMISRGMRSIRTTLLGKKGYKKISYIFDYKGAKVQAVVYLKNGCRCLRNNLSKNAKASMADKFYKRMPFKLKKSGIYVANLKQYYRFMRN